MFENPIISFLSMFFLISFIGFGISLLFLEIDLARRILIGPIIGYSITSLSTAYLSFIGFTTEQTSLYLFFFLISITIISIIFKRKKINNTEISLKFLIPIFIFGLINAAIVFAPMILGEAPWLFNDHTVYISGSEYLRDHSYNTMANAQAEPWQRYTWQDQITHFRIGSRLFVSFLAVLFNTPHTIYIYPSIISLLGLLLTLAIGILYLSIREKTKINLSELLFVLFFTLIPIQLNSNIISSGFLCQTLGLILFITLTALVYETFNTSKKRYITIWLLFAALILTYHEITLFYGTAVFTYILFEYFYKKFRDKKVYLNFLAAHVLAFALSPIAAKIFILGIISSYHMNGVGWHINESLITYIQMIFGQDFYKFSPSIILKPGILIPFLYIYLISERRFIDDEKNILRFFFIWTMPFLLGIIFYRFFKLDPFTQETGHTWNIFKIMNWSYWIVSIIIGLAIYSFFKRSKSRKAAIILSIIMLFPSVASNIKANYSNAKYGMNLYTENYKNPLDEFKQIALDYNKYSPANIIDYQSHLNYPYLILSILKDNSTGDLDGLGGQLKPSSDPDFFPWINYRREHDNTSEPIRNLAGFLIYPQGSSSVYLFDGFYQREVYSKDHLAWLTTKNGVIKIVVPKGSRAQFSTLISNWQATAAPVTIMLNDKTLLASNIGTAPVKFTSPVLGEGNHQFLVNYYGPLHTPDANDGRSLGLMFKNTDIVSIK